MTSSAALELCRVASTLHFRLSGLRKGGEGRKHRLRDCPQSRLKRSVLLPGKPRHNAPFKSHQAA